MEDYTWHNLHYYVLLPITNTLLVDTKFLYFKQAQSITEVDVCFMMENFNFSYYKTTQIYFRNEVKVSVLMGDLKACLGHLVEESQKRSKTTLDELKKSRNTSLSTNKSNWKCLSNKTYAHLVTFNQEILAFTKFLWSSQPKADFYLTKHSKDQCCKIRKPSRNNTPHTAHHALALPVLGHTEKFFRKILQLFSWDQLVVLQYHRDTIKSKVLYIVQ